MVLTFFFRMSWIFIHIKMCSDLTLDDPAIVFLLSLPTAYLISPSSGISDWNSFVIIPKVKNRGCWSSCNVNIFFCFSAILHKVSLDMPKTSLTWFLYQCFATFQTLPYSLLMKFSCTMNPFEIILLMRSILMDFLSMHLKFWYFLLFFMCVLPLCLHMAVRLCSLHVFSLNQYWNSGLFFVLFFSDKDSDLAFFCKKTLVQGSFFSKRMYIHDL